MGQKWREAKWVGGKVLEEFHLIALPYKF